MRKLEWKEVTGRFDEFYMGCHLENDNKGFWISMGYPVTTAAI